MSPLEQLLIITYTLVSTFIIYVQNKLRDLTRGKVQVWSIVWKKREDECAPVREVNFICKFRTHLSLDCVLEPQYVPVAYNPSKVILLQVPNDVYDTGRYPFFYHALFAEAKTKVVAPLGEFLELIDNQPWPDLSLILLWSTGRCGSTLLANLFTSFDNCCTVSEPDDVFEAYACKPHISEAEFEKLLRVALKYHVIQVKKRFPNVKCVVVKTRSMAYWYLTKFPVELRDRSTHIFMYRDALPTFKSFDRAFGNLGRKVDSVVGKVVKLDQKIEMHIRPLEDVLGGMEKFRERIEIARNVRRRSNEMLVRVAFGGLPYDYLLHTHLVQNGIFGDRLFAVKYERLIADPVLMFEKIASRVKSFEFVINDHVRERLLELSNIDSQKNSKFSKNVLAVSGKKDSGKSEQMFLEMMSACQLDEEGKNGYIFPETV